MSSEVKPEVKNCNFSSGSSHKGQELNTYSIETRLKCIEEVKNGVEISTILLNHSIKDRRCLIRWVDEYAAGEYDEALSWSVEERKSVFRMPGGGRKPMDPELDEVLLQFIAEQGKQKITNQLLIKEALRFRPKFCGGTEDPRFLTRANDFLYRFRRRRKEVLLACTSIGPHSSFNTGDVKNVRKGSNTGKKTPQHRVSLKKKVEQKCDIKHNPQSNQTSKPGSTVQNMKSKHKNPFSDEVRELISSKNPKTAIEKDATTDTQNGSSTEEDDLIASPSSLSFDVKQLSNPEKNLPYNDQIFQAVATDCCPDISVSIQTNSPHFFTGYLTGKELACLPQLLSKHRLFMQDKQVIEEIDLLFSRVEKKALARLLAQDPKTCMVRNNFRLYDLLGLLSTGPVSDHVLTVYQHTLHLSQQEVYFVHPALYKYMNDFDFDKNNVFQHCDWEKRPYIFWPIKLNGTDWVCAVHRNKPGACVFFVDVLQKEDTLPSNIISILERMTSCSSIPYQLNPVPIKIPVLQQTSEDSGPCVNAIAALFCEEGASFIADSFSAQFSTVKMRVSQLRKIWDYLFCLLPTSYLEHQQDLGSSESLKL